jgi:hypothetical protein
VSFLPKICGVLVDILSGDRGVKVVLTHHDELAADVFDAVQAVVVLAVAESVRVDIGGEVAHGGSDAFVEGAAESEVAAETHAGGSLWR